MGVNPTRLQQFTLIMGSFDVHTSNIQDICWILWPNLTCGLLFADPCSMVLYVTYDLWLKNDSTYLKNIDRHTVSCSMSLPMSCLGWKSVDRTFLPSELSVEQQVLMLEPSLWETIKALKIDTSTSFKPVCTLAFQPNYVPTGQSQCNRAVC